MKPLTQLLIVGFIAFVSCSFQIQAAPPDHAVEQRVKPILDQPLRDAAICRGPDGAYYLTGTVAAEIDQARDKAHDKDTRPSPALRSSPSEGGTPDTRHSTPDFLNNDGIYLWKSKDLKEWQPLGKVWCLAKDARTRWTRQKGVKPGVQNSPRVRGVVSPEIHYLKDTFWIPFSMSHGGTGLLKSKTGKAEGPYEYVGMFTTKSADPSLFQDDPADGGTGDGKVYFVFGEGWIAPMNEEMTEFESKPILLQPEAETYKGWGEPGGLKFADHNPTVGSHGAYLFKANGLYHLAAARHDGRLSDTAVHDTYVASAENLMGPYSRSRLMIPHGGQTTVFTDTDGNLYGTFSGDQMAVFQNKPGIVPLRYDGFLKQVWKPTLGNAEAHPLEHPTHNRVVVEKGILPILRPLDLPGLFDHIRDPHVLNAPDGYYYLSGTVAHRKMPDPEHPGHYMWRSKDLKNWEFMGEVWNISDWKGPGSPYKPQPPRFCGLTQNFEGIWGPRPAYVKGNYYIPWGPAYGGCYLLKSKTGKPEGPYEDVNEEFHPSGIAPVLFEDDDGSVYYLCTGDIKIGKMKDDMSGLAEPLRTIRPADGSDIGYEGPFMIKEHDKYILFIADRGTVNLPSGVADYHQTDTYDWKYCCADNIYGPYSTAKVALPHAGCTGLFKSKDGQWYNTVFCSDTTAPFKCKFNVVPIEIKLVDGEIVIEQKNGGMK